MSDRRVKYTTLISFSVEEAVELLQRGECVGMPTESVYGLAADACNEAAVQKIYKAKGRPSYNPLIIHVKDLEMALEWGEFNESALKLATYFWDFSSNTSRFPLTLVVPLKPNKALAYSVTAGLQTVGIRVPKHPLALELIQKFKNPLAAPSANRSNYISPTTAQAVFDDLKGVIPFILDGGHCSQGIESTIIDAETKELFILRQGGTPLEVLRSITPSIQEGRGEQVVETGISTNELISANTHENMLPMKAPGMLTRHYAPKTPLRLNAHSVMEGELYIGFGPGYPSSFESLSAKGCLEEACRNLYVLLRKADALSPLRIAVAPIPQEGLGVAINDRLNRGATLGYTR